MRRWYRLLAALAGLVALCTGCATNRPSNPFARQAGKSTPAQFAKTNSADDPSLADDKGAAGKRGSTRTGSASGEADSSRAGGRGHDPATMAYIENELRDATPEERADYMKSLKGLHPEAVRQILHSRRLTLRTLQKPELAAVRSPRYDREPIQTVGGESPPGGAAPHRGYPSEGLGTVSAWQGQTTDANRAVQSNTPVDATANPNWSQNGSAPPQIGGQPAVGHSSGYRADLPADGFATPASATARLDSFSNSSTRVNPAVAQSFAGQNSSAATGSALSVASAPGPGPGPVAAAAGVPISAGGGLQEPAGSVAESVAGSAAWREQMSRLISTTEAEAFELQPGETDVQKQAYLEKQVHLRMLYLISGQQERAVQAIPGLDPADQEFWQQTFWGLTNYFDSTSMPSAADRAAQTVAQMTNAVLRLQEKAKLELQSVSFCHKISSFGNYEKYPRDEFTPGQEVLLYAEVANIHSDPISDGKFKTSLKSTIEIYRHGSQGELIERIDLPDTVDVCRTHRRDYFHAYQFTIPTKLALGPHVLKLTVEDQLSRRVGTSTLNFTVK